MPASTSTYESGSKADYEAEEGTVDHGSYKSYHITDISRQGRGNKTKHCAFRKDNRPNPSILLKSFRLSVIKTDWESKMLCYTGIVYFHSFLQT